MAKRFTDTEIWDKEWYMNLSCKHKCLIRFLFDKCDQAGVWSENLSLASSYVGEVITDKDLLSLGNRIKKISEKKYFISDFIEFQYGTLSPACKPHLKIISLLEKYKIDFKGYPKGIQREQEKDKDKEMETDKDKGGTGGKEIIPQMEKIWKKENINYPFDKNKDTPSLLSISKFICEQSGIIFNPFDQACKDTILHSWRHLCEHIPKDNFYKNYSIQQVDKYIQSIVLSIQNGKSNSSNGKGNQPITSQKLNEAHAKYFGQ